MLHGEISALVLPSCITELADRLVLLLDLLLDGLWKHHGSSGRRLHSSWKPLRGTWNPSGRILGALGGLLGDLLGLQIDGLTRSDFPFGATKKG